MTSLSSALRRRVGDNERGLAMIMVIVTISILSLLIVAAIAYSTGSLRKARDDQDWNGALAAAYAGISEYESRLANDLGYFAFGNPTAQFSAGSVLELPTGAAANPAFGIGTSGTWAQVAGSGGTSEFRYEVDNSKYYTDGTLRLRSTGRVGDETRTIVADLKQLGFIDFLYFTDYEVMDPQAINPTSTTNCAIYHPNSRPSCTLINFGGADEIRGPLHTNDAIRTNGAAKFLGKTTTSWENSSGANYIGSGSSPTFAISGDPQFRARIGMPATNSQLKKETRSDLPAEVPSPGCLYTGPTSIEFHSNGTMTVISPWTQYTNTSGNSDTSGTNPSKCGTPGTSGLAKTTGSGASRTYVGQTLSVPANLVVYVQNVPTTSGNVNRQGSSVTTPPWTNQVACPSNGNSLGYPIANESIPFTNAYGCRNGDIFVKGTLKGQATLAAENYVYVTDDLSYNDSGEDMLGLVGNNAVWVWNPARSNGNSLLGNNGRRIDAAILSVAHTFMVQNYDTAGARGTLTVNGAIAQRFRGPVGMGNGNTMSTGYAKDYNYDERFRYTAPPKFLSPVTTTYGVNVWVEVSAAFDGQGAYR